MKKLDTLYGVDKKGGVKQWSVWSDNGVVYVEHGKYGGKLQVKETVCEAKNVGRSNETTPEQQAESEAQSKWEKQYKKYYRRDIEEARALTTEGVMLAQDYTKKPHYLEDNFDASPKLDGLRVKSVYDQDKADCVALDGAVWLSRGGETYPVPIHLNESLKLLHERTGLPMLDGEAYIHGIKLQKIQSCVKKPNDLTPRVTFQIFDVPMLGKTWRERLEVLMTVVKPVIEELGIQEFIDIVPYVPCKKEELDDLLKEYLKGGFEGVMMRNLLGEYEFQNKRSNDLLKYKIMKDSECKVIDCTEDKNGEGVLLCEWKGVKFELKMKGSHESRLFEKQKHLIGEWVNFKYQDTTEDGIPTFAVGRYVRKCDENGNPLE